LQSLSLGANQLSGSIPNFNLPNLTRLHLAENQLSGSIPNFNLPNLKELWLSSNQLSGSIPNFNLPNLENLTLYHNQLSGSIPNFNLPNLTRLHLAENQLSESIPNFNLPNLKELWLAKNQLTGSIPNFNLSELTGFSLDSNCGLVAYDTTQESVLSKKDFHWKDKNRICPVSNSTITPNKTSNNVGTVNDKEPSMVGIMAIFFSIAVFVGGIYLLILGSTKRVVIYYDYRDLSKSFLPVLFFGMAIFVFKSEPSVNSFANFVLHWIISAFFGVLGLIRTAITVNTAIQHNRDLDIAMGLIIGFFKIIFIFLAVILVINRIIDIIAKMLGGKTFKETVVSITLVAIIGFITSAIVNGEEVYLKKGWLLPEK